MDTVVTPLSGEWTDLTAIWAAATPPAADGETITVQPADQGASRAIEVIQTGSAPDAGDRGHLLVSDETLTVTGATGRRHYGRAYMGGAKAVASGTGISGARGGGAGGGGSGGGDLALLHSPAVTPVAERMGNVPGQIRGTVMVDISDLTPFVAITDGTLSIGTETVTGIDLSAVATINDVIVALNAAISANPALASYRMTLPYISPNYYGGVSRSDGDVEAVGGTVEPPVRPGGAGGADRA